MAEKANNKKKLKVGKKKLLLLVVILALVGGLVFFGLKYKNANDKVNKITGNPQESAKLEVEIITERVGKLTDLPKETPTLATVQDKEKLKNQAFFANAENGDKVLIYTQAKKAYLFRPSTNKIINIAPVNIGDQSAQPQQ